MKRIASLLVLLSFAACATTPGVVRHAGPHHTMGRMVEQADVVNFNPQGTGTTATPGALTLQNIAGTFKQVDDQGNVTTIGGGGGGVTSVAGLTGVVTGANLNAALPVATQSLAGVQSSTDKGYLDYLSGRWENVQERFMLSKIPQLTGFEYIKIGIINAGATAFPSVDGTMEGGGLTSTVSTFMAAGVFQTPQTGKWSFCYRAKFVVPSAGHTGMVGLMNAAASHSIMVGTATAISTTNFALRIIGGTGATVAGSIAVDANAHDLCATDDGTTIKLYVDSVDSTASTASSNSFGDESMGLAMANQASGDVKVMKFDYGFIQP